MGEDKKDKNVIGEVIMLELMRLVNENNNLASRILELKRRNRELENKIIKLNLELDTYN